MHISVLGRRPHTYELKSTMLIVIIIPQMLCRLDSVSLNIELHEAGRLYESNVTLVTHRSQYLPHSLMINRS